MIEKIKEEDGRQPLSRQEIKALENMKEGFNGNSAYLHLLTLNEKYGELKENGGSYEELKTINEEFTRLENSMFEASKKLGFSFDSPQELFSILLNFRSEYQKIQENGGSIEELIKMNMLMLYFIGTEKELIKIEDMIAKNRNEIAQEAFSGVIRETGLGYGNPKEINKAHTRILLENYFKKAFSGLTIKDIGSFDSNKIKDIIKGALNSLYEKEKNSISYNEVRNAYKEALKEQMDPTVLRKLEDSFDQIEREIADTVLKHGTQSENTDKIRINDLKAR